jgi:excisionase family DNA binding protein
MPKRNSENPRSMDGLLTVSEVANRLHVHPNTVRQWSDSGILKAYRFGYRRDRRFRPEEIEKFINNNQY